MLPQTPSKWCGVLSPVESSCGDLPPVALVSNPTHAAHKPAACSSSVDALSLRRCEVSGPISLQGMGELCLLGSLRELRLGFRCRFAPRRPSKLGASLSLLSSLTHLEVCTLMHTPAFLRPKTHCHSCPSCCAILPMFVGIPFLR